MLVWPSEDCRFALHNSVRTDAIGEASHVLTHRRGYTATLAAHEYQVKLWIHRIIQT
jgi:hypothetical protein